LHVDSKITNYGYTGVSWFDVDWIQNYKKEIEKGRSTSKRLLLLNLAR